MLSPGSLIYRAAMPLATVSSLRSMRLQTTDHLRAELQDVTSLITVLPCFAESLICLLDTPIQLS